MKKNIITKPAVAKVMIGILSIGLLAGGTVPQLTDTALAAESEHSEKSESGNEPAKDPEPTEEATPTPEPSPTEEATPTPDPNPTEEPTPDPNPTEEPTPDPNPTEEPTPDPNPTEDPDPTPEVKSSNADLKELYISSSDTWAKGILKLDPALNKDHDRYKASYDGERQSLNIWPTVEEEHAQIKVYALSGVKYSTVEKDETIKESKDKEGHVYWKIYFGDQSKEAKVRVQVTAQDGTRRDYYLTLDIKDKTAPVLKKISASRISPDKASVVYKTNERGLCYYRIVDAGKKAKKPDTSGKGIEVQAGSNTLSLTKLSEGEKDIVIVVKDNAGNVSKSLVIRIPDIRKRDTGTTDNNNNNNQTAQRPGYGGNKSEAVTPGKGNNGEGSLDKMKAIGGKGTSSGKKNQDSGNKEEETKDKKLAAGIGASKNGKDSGTKNGSDSKNSKADNRKKDKKSEDDVTAVLSEESGMEETADGAAVSSEKEKSITQIVEGKVTYTWTHMRTITKILFVIALAGALYLILWAAARRSFKKYKRKNQLLPN